MLVAALHGHTTAHDWLLGFGAALLVLAFFAEFAPRNPSAGAPSSLWRMLVAAALALAFVAAMVQ